MVSSTKSMSGTCWVQRVGWKPYRQGHRPQCVPPTSTHEKPGEDCDLDYVPGAARDHAIDVAVSNSFGFGGTNAVIVFRQFDS